MEGFLLKGVSSCALLFCRLAILLIEEVLHHLGCKIPCKYWDKLPINYQLVSRISSINSRSTCFYVSMTFWKRSRLEKYSLPGEDEDRIELCLAVDSSYLGVSVCPQLVMANANKPWISWAIMIPITSWYTIRLILFEWIEPTHLWSHDMYIYIWLYMYKLNWIHPTPQAVTVANRKFIYRDFLY